jgi:hypothetical protein
LQRLTGDVIRTSEMSAVQAIVAAMPVREGLRSSEAESAHAERRAALMAEYAEVNNNFRMLTNIRFKLLAVLPLAPAAAAILTAAGSGGGSNRSVDARAVVLSLFGLLVTAGLASYNARNDQIYLWHVDRAAAIERELGIPDGSFANRPNAWFAVSLAAWRWHVGHVTSVTIIYLSSIALWLLVGLVAGSHLLWGTLPMWGYAATLVVAVAAVAAGWGVVRHQRKRMSREMRRNADDAIGHAAALGLAGRVDPPLGDCHHFIASCVELAGKDRDRGERETEIRERIDFYAEQARAGRWSDYTRSASDDCSAAAEYVALIVDLPASWLLDAPRRRRTL